MSDAQATRVVFSAAEVVDSLIEALPIPAAFLDGRRCYRLVNRRYAELYEASEAQLIGAAFDSVAGAENARRAEMKLAKALAGETMVFETSWRLPGLGDRLLEFQLVPARDTRSADRGIYIFVQDLTDRLHAEAELVHASKMDAMGQLTGGIAHDFNNLLTIISGNLELLKRELGDRLRDDPREMIDDALSAAQQGSDLTDQLLAFARKQNLAPVALDVAAVVENAGRLLRRTIGRDIELATAVESELPLARADRAKLETAILNLAINGRDAMTAGGRLTITARSRTINDGTERPQGTTLDPGRYVALAVADDGRGMEAHVAAHAFEPFFTTKGQRHGTGLGLSMVYGFARQSHGDVGLETTPGRGTTVTIYLPALEQRFVATDPVPYQPSSAVPTRPRGTVLLVEDEERVRRLATRSFRQLGFSVLAVGTADDALAILESDESVDLLFSDVVMPGDQDGSGLAHTVRRRWPDLPIILASGFTAKAADFDGPLLHKPYSSAELAAAVKRAMSGCGEGA